MKKTYISIKNLRYTTSVTVVEDGKKKEVPMSFDGGFTTPYKRDGIFKTENELVQEAIKNSPRYGIDYAELDNNGNIIPKDQVAKEVEAPKEAQKVEPTEAEKLQADGFALVTDVTTIAEARKWLVKNDSTITPEMIANKDKTIATAKEKKIIFTNFK